MTAILMVNCKFCKSNNIEFKGAYTHNPFSKENDNPYHIDDGKGGKEDISWLL